MGQGENLPGKVNEATVLVRLDGVGLTASGKEVKNHFFDAFKQDLDEYQEIILTAAEAKRLSTQMQKLRTGFQAAMPILCPGAKLCPISTICPLVKLDNERKAKGEEVESVLPISKQCSVENHLMQVWLEGYCADLKITEEDSFDLLLAKELVELDLLEFRISTYMSRYQNALGVGQNVIGLDQNTGEPIIVEQIAPAMELKLKLKDRRSKILESLVATRKEKYKKDAALKEGNNNDPSSIAAALKKKLEESLKLRQINVI